MRQKFHFLLLLLTLLTSPLAMAMNAVFWQPQLRDSEVSESQWQALMHTLHQQGFDTLVLQWTQYGTAFADEKGRQQLIQRATDARNAGLKLIVGLHSDPDFFTRQKQTGAARKHYLNRLRIADVRQARLWNLEVQPDGWYISAEIDDLNWRNPQARAQLLYWLRDTRSQLENVANKPVYISSFFAGNMTPESYQQMLTGISAQGVKVWVQDGRGVGKLSATEREHYLTPAVGCETQSPASGTVYEIFHVIPGNAFHARPLSAREMSVALAQKSNCGKDRLYFSLRYLPAAQGILSYHAG